MYYKKNTRIIHLKHINGHGHIDPKPTYLTRFNPLTRKTCSWDKISKSRIAVSRNNNLLVKLLCALRYKLTRILISLRIPSRCIFESKAYCQPLEHIFHNHFSDIVSKIRRLIREKQRRKDFFYGWQTKKERFIRKIIKLVREGNP